MLSLILSEGLFNKGRSGKGESKVQGSRVVKRGQEGLSSFPFTKASCQCQTPPKFILCFPILLTLILDYLIILGCLSFPRVQLLILRHYLLKDRLIFMAGTFTPPSV